MINEAIGDSMKISIIGAGTWGCALANVIANNGYDVNLYSKFSSEIESLEQTHANPNLPGAILSDQINFTCEPSDIHDSEIVIIAVPSIFVRETCESIKDAICKDTIIATVSKGIEEKTHYTMSQIISSVLPGNSVVALSGPTHAEEVAINQPTTIVSACEDLECANKVAHIFQGTCIKAFTNFDILGVEIGGAFKNIIALVCGVANGLGFGDNMQAAIMTRGINEIARLGKKMGCEAQTFYGLSGIGDLIVTSMSKHSRNNRAGNLIGQGLSVDEAKKEVGMVVEGLNALKPALELANAHGVKMSIVEGLDRILYNNEEPREVMKELMSQPAKSEIG